MERSTRVVLWVAAALGLLASVAVVLGVLLWLVVQSGRHNPLLLAFLDSFEVVNTSGEDVWITPIGMWEGSGRYGPLPRYRDTYPPAVRSRQTHDIPLPAGASITITYDWDDVNFRHILIRTASGAPLILDTDTKGTLDSCYPPQQDTYEIPPLDTLAKAPLELLPCATGRQVVYSRAVSYPEGATPRAATTP